MTLILNMKKWFILVALVFVMVVAAEVLDIRVTSAAPAKPITLRMMTPSEAQPSHLSPLVAGETIRMPVIFNVLEPLVQVGKDGKPTPKLATKWEHSADLTKWRFYLRRGVKFHNGDNFTARDVVELVKWSLEEKALSVLFRRVPAKEALAVDDYTVDLIFETPQPLLLVYGRYFLVPPVAITRDNRRMAVERPIGTGPYRFVEWQKGLNVKLTKFEDYWGPKPQIDDVVITFRAEAGVRLAALMVGEVDWISEIGPEQAGRAPKVVRVTTAETVWIRFDEYIQKELGRMSILADKRLRMAIEYAIDRQALVALYGGFITPSLGQFASPGDFGFNRNLKTRPHDLEKARALVKEAGAVGRTVTFVASTDRFNKCREVAEAVAYMIEQTGLKVKLTLIPSVEVNRYKNSLGKDRDLEADIILSPTDSLMEVEARYRELFVEGGTYSATPDPEPTWLYKAVQAETDFARRWEKLAKAWAYVYEEAHYIPLFKLESLWGLSKNLHWDMDIGGRPFISDMRFID